MIIPPSSHLQSSKKEAPTQGVYLESSHLCFGPELLEFLGKEEQNVFMAIYPEKGFLLVAPISHSFFPKLHPSTQHMLKIKNQEGARSIALHEYLIDHAIDARNRPLKYDLIQKSKLLKIYMK